MSNAQTIIKIPEALATELNKLAGHRRRSAYAADVLRKDVRHNKQRAALALTKGAWKPQDHPELAQGGAAYVEKLRAEPDDRFEAILKRRKR